LAIGGSIAGPTLDAAAGARARADHARLPMGEAPRVRRRDQVGTVAGVTTPDAPEAVALVRPVRACHAFHGANGALRGRGGGAVPTCPAGGETGALHRAVVASEAAGGW